MGARRCDPRSDAALPAFAPRRSLFFFRFTATGAFRIMDASERPPGTGAAASP